MGKTYRDMKPKRSTEFQNHIGLDYDMIKRLVESGIKRGLIRRNAISEMREVVDTAKKQGFIKGKFIFLSR